MSDLQHRGTEEQRHGGGDGGFDAEVTRKADGDVCQSISGDVCQSQGGSEGVKEKNRLKPVERPAEASGTLEARELRRKIQAHRIRRLGWSDFVFYFVLEKMGFGRSLRALGEAELRALWSMISKYRKHGKPVEYTYDKQGMYMHALCKQAGWDERTLQGFLLVHYKKTHWNVLDAAEKTAVIRTLQEITNPSIGDEDARH